MSMEMKVKLHCDGTSGLPRLWQLLLSMEAADAGRDTSENIGCRALSVLRGSVLSFERVEVNDAARSLMILGDLPRNQRVVLLIDRVSYH